jgi:hypothetical protein
LCSRRYAHVEVNGSRPYAAWFFALQSGDAMSPEPRKNAAVLCGRAAAGGARLRTELRDIVVELEDAGVDHAITTAKF